MNADTRAALDEALQGEYESHASYRAVLAAFGNLRPFDEIVEAQERHVQALLRIYAGHEVDAPADPWAGRIEAPATLEDAYRRGIERARANDAMYARILGRVDDANIRVVMSQLREAARARHLPAFERCIESFGRSARAVDGRT